MLERSNRRRRSIASWAMLLIVPCAACDAPPEAVTEGPICDDAGVPRYVIDPHVLVPGIGSENHDCRGDDGPGSPTCQHNENTDLYRFGSAIYLVHRTAESQILGPNSSLRVYRSDDEGATFAPLSVIPAPMDRDIRDPSFYRVGDRLFIKAITRIRGFTERDEDVQSVSVAFASDDGGVTWSDVGPIGPVGWGFWRVHEQGAKLYSAAYEDGDLRVVLFSSDDGVTWTEGNEIYGVAADTPLETELVTTPGGRMLALIRMDGTDDELLGENGRLRTKLCWADPPFDHFDCPYELEGDRMDGAVHFWEGQKDPRLFVVARSHLQPTLRKRTTVYELVGDFERGPLSAVRWAELPSAGDTSYAGAVALDGDRFLLSWYSGDVAKDPPWTASMLSGTDIWLGTFDASALPKSAPTDAECPKPRDAEPPPADPTDCTLVTPDPKASCGFPCDQGNALGVGEYCTTEGGQCADNATATTCSDALNGSLLVTSYVCTLVCDADTDCGPGASCRCPLLASGGQICGCILDSCVMPPGTEGMLGN